MRIEVLEYFLEIAECRSFSQASSNLFISQQGLSKAMRALESELGVVLFRKKGRGIELTEEGSILKSHATEIVRQNDRARERFFKMQVGPSATDATVNVFATSYVCNAIFNLLDEELGEHGLDNCSVSECELNEIIAAIECGETNFGLVNILQEDVAELDAFPYLTFTPFLTMRITVKAPKSLAPQFPDGQITPRQMSDLSLAYFNEPVLNKFVKRACQGPDREAPTIVLHSTNIERINSLVRNSKAVTFSDTFTQSVRKEAEGIISLDLNPPHWFFVGVLENTGLQKSSDQYGYVQRLRALIRYKHRHYLGKYAV